MDIKPMIIRITKVQQGNYPEWVRNAWLGCELPCIPGIEEIFPTSISVTPQELQSTEEGHAQGKVPEEHKITGFLVRRDRALIILRKKLPAAALWYSNNNYLQPNSYFAFETQDVEIVEEDESLPATALLKPRV